MSSSRHLFRALVALFFSTSLLTIACKEKQPTLFESLPSSQTKVDFANNLGKRKLLNILYYLYYYNGAGVATGDINNDGLPDLYFAANSKNGNRLYLNKGNMVFEDITEKAGVAGTADWSTGVTMADVNGDGWLDIYVSTISSRYGLTGHNELFINNHDNSFKESSAEYGLNTSCFTTQTAFFDFDHDGDLDCYMLNQSHHPHSNIVDTVNRQQYDSLSGDRLYRNDRNLHGGKFVDISKQAGIYQSNLGYGLGLAIADVNNDGWDDIYVGNDFHENDYYYVNNGNGSFTESGASHFRHYSRFSMGNDVADYNNDGQLDLVTVDMLPPDEKTLKTYGSDENPDIYKVKLELRGYQYQYSKNCLQKNNGNGVSFSETALQSGVAATDWSWCPLFADLDNDGKKDLFITSGIWKRPVDLDFVKFAGNQKNKGMDTTDKFDEETIAAMPDGSTHPFVYKGDGDLNFEDKSEQWGMAALKGCTNGASYADLDGDGDLDLVANSLNAPALILKNNSAPKNYIDLKLEGADKNTNGLGAKAYVYAAGHLQYQQLMSARGFMSSSSTQLHFGLDTLKNIDSILVVWPNQKFQVIYHPPVSKLLTVRQKEAVKDFHYTDFFPAKSEMLEDQSASVGLNWSHKENDFVDYNVQYLIPHALSTRGPKIAVADLDKNGLEDFYVCGAKQQPGALMMQQSPGKFHSVQADQFEPYAIAEEVDAIFFDANGDGWQDLFVLTGGNEVPANQLALLDRLYLNDGKGNLKREDNPMSVVYENKSCVTVSDIDHDGDMDIFIGNLASPVLYSDPKTSYLFLNDGKAHFTKAGDNIIPLYQIGMVTTAAFSDFDKDGWDDLVVTGEWMPMKIFKNNHGKFTVVDLPNSTGWWQTVYPADINGDGYTDILAGNWGWNSKLYAGKNGPLKMYIKDFDKNGSIEQIMCYTINGNEYPFLAKDELERSLPVLKKAYLTYGEVAGQTVQYMFYDLFKDYKELKAEVLSSSCFLNDGKGNFKRMDLPKELQMAPIYAFAPNTEKTSYWGVGNFFGVIPYEGRYDALQPSLFGYNKSNAALTYQAQLSSLSGEFRDAKWIDCGAKGRMLVLARNNKPLVFLK